MLFDGASCALSDAWRSERRQHLQQRAAQELHRQELLEQQVTLHTQQQHIRLTRLRGGSDPSGVRPTLSLDLLPLFEKAGMLLVHPGPTNNHASQRRLSFLHSNTSLACSGSSTLPMRSYALCIACTLLQRPCLGAALQH